MDCLGWWLQKCRDGNDDDMEVLSGGGVVCVVSGYSVYFCC